MKLKIIILLTMISVQILLEASVAQRSYNVELTDKVARPDMLWNFEIQNKYPDVVTVSIINNKGTLRITKIISNEINKRKIRIANVDVKDGFSIMLDVHGKIMTTYIKPNPNRTSMYLTIGNNLNMYPQTGAGFGLFGKTDSGLPLDKNKNFKLTDIMPESR